MRNSVENDLQDACEAVEALLKRYDKLSMTERVDCAARLKGITKNAEAFDKQVKDEIKGKLGDGKEGTVKGETFKAVLKLIPVRRFNQGAFKADCPEDFEAYCEDKNEPRITFEPR